MTPHDHGTNAICYRAVAALLRLCAREAAAADVVELTWLQQRLCETYGGWVGADSPAPDWLVELMGLTDRGAFAAKCGERAALVWKLFEVAEAHAGETKD